MAKFGYLRWTKKDEKLIEQLELMQEYKIDELFQEKVVGKYTDRPAFQKMLGAICKRDQVIVASLDSLGRDYGEIARNVSYMKQKEIILTVMDATFLAFNTGNDALDGVRFDLFLSLLDYLAHQEGDPTKGRPIEYSLESENPEKRRAYQTIIKLLRSGASVAEAAQESGVSRPTVYKIKRVNGL